MLRKLARKTLVGLVLAASSCGGKAEPQAKAPASPPPPTPTPVVDPGVVEYDDLALSLFKERDVSGSFVMHDEAKNKTIVVGKEDADVERPPCSTFKIANTLIGLETGVISDARFSLKWDGQKREVEEWNRDQTLTTAMRHSVVWFYQEIARRVGEARMKTWVTELDYGNKVVKGPIDAFWLEDAPLRISPMEQVRFLQRLAKRDVKARAENVEIVMKVVPTEVLGPSVVRAKTGLCTDSLGRVAGSTNPTTEVIGWLVGWVESKTNRQTFALGLRSPQKKGELARVTPLRRELAYALLHREGAL